MSKVGSIGGNGGALDSILGGNYFSNSFLKLPGNEYFSKLEKN